MQKLKQSEVMRDGLLVVIKNKTKHTFQSKKVVALHGSLMPIFIKLNIIKTLKALHCHMMACGGIKSIIFSPHKKKRPFFSVCIINKCLNLNVSSKWCFTHFPHKQEVRKDTSVKIS